MPYKPSNSSSLEFTWQMEFIFLPKNNCIIVRSIWDTILLSEKEMAQGWLMEVIVGRDGWLAFLASFQIKVFIQLFPCNVRREKNKKTFLLHSNLFWSFLISCFSTENKNKEKSHFPENQLKIIINCLGDEFKLLIFEIKNFCNAR